MYLPKYKKTWIILRLTQKWNHLCAQQSISTIPTGLLPETSVPAFMLTHNFGNSSSFIPGTLPPCRLPFRILPLPSFFPTMRSCAFLPKRSIHWQPRRRSSTSNVPDAFFTKSLPQNAPHVLRLCNRQAPPRRI